MYLKINDSDIKYQASVVPFRTQHGNVGVNIIGDVPQTNKGFKLYDEDDNIVSDYSSFIYLYKENAYTEAEEVIEEGECSFEPIISDHTIDNINKRISNLNDKVSEITPYKQEKMAYYGEKEKTFYNVPKGNVSVFFDNYSGDYSVNRISDRLTVSFPQALEQQTTVNIMIQ